MRTQGGFSSFLGEFRELVNARQENVGQDRPDRLWRRLRFPIPLSDKHFII
jgi:hypothetical protein